MRHGYRPPPARRYSRGRSWQRRGAPDWRVGLEDDGLLTPVRRRKLRRGFTTGSCATAAATAATRALLTQQPIAEVTIHLPAGSYVTFRLERCQFDGMAAECALIKDAGDDPDVTHLAEVVARVTMRD